MKTDKSLNHNKRHNNAQVLYLDTANKIDGDKKDRTVRTRERIIGTSQTPDMKGDTLKTNANTFYSHKQKLFIEIFKHDILRWLAANQRYEKSPKSNKTLAKTKIKMPQIKD